MLVTTLTKKMAEDLTDYLADAGVRVQYLHSDIDTITRIEILRELRLGSIDVLVGIDLLRRASTCPRWRSWPSRCGQGGLPRSASSLIQTMGPAAGTSTARSSWTPTPSPTRCASGLGDPARAGGADRYNKEHGINPQTTASR